MKCRAIRLARNQEFNNSYFMDDNKDPHLDIPAEAAREKHINFMDAEEKTVTENISEEDRFGSTKEDEQRRKQWQQGLEEGRKAAENNEQ